MTIVPVPVPVDVGKLGEPLTKLIDVAAKAGYHILEPRLIRRKAEAEGDATITKAEAERKAAIIKAEADIVIEDMYARADETRKAIWIRRQRNVESIVSQAAKQLPVSVNREPVDEDWAAQFFEYSQDVGNEEMQKIWASILAGEVARPGRFSPRTLALVKVLRQSDALLFRRFCNYLLVLNGNQIHLDVAGSRRILKEKGLPSEGILHLVNLGLVNINVTLTMTTDENAIDYQGRCYLVTGGKPVFDAIRLTDIGIELAPLCDVEPDEEYLRAVLDSIAQRYTIRALNKESGSPQTVESQNV